jgi:ACS family hexuronate transporter-like MFS transporter
VIASRRFAVTLILLFCIHTTWQLLRVWLPMFLQRGRGYSESDALLFNSFYFVATDIGCIAAGAVSLWLARRGLTPHAAKCRVYLACSLLTALTVLVAVRPWVAVAATLLPSSARARGCIRASTVRAGSLVATCRQNDRPAWHAGVGHLLAGA